MVIQRSLPSAWSHFNDESKETFEAKKQELQKRRAARRGNSSVIAEDVYESSEDEGSNEED